MKVVWEQKIVVKGDQQHPEVWPQRSGLIGGLAARRFEPIWTGSPPGTVTRIQKDPPGHQPR